MRINAFEGARRVARLIVLLVVVVGGFRLLTENPRPLEMVFTISGPQEKPVWSDQDPYSIADIDVLRKIVDRETPKGTKVSIYLNFLPRRAESGEMVIPYREDPDQWFGLPRYSKQVMTYADEVASEFQLNPQLERWADSSRWKRRLKQFWDGAWPGIVTLAGFWFFTWVVGWVIRGFLGIPSGMDRSPEPAPSKTEDS